ncbi:MULTISPECIES: 2-amino-4-hydroxy-6-hydroxymethyldihydropteridine diphosphokinase [Dietzia]|uniref:2-amino-4-hydroxy-6-hydroxymethyldihydropteridine diphosphokinase n=1 Tax=Dietzia cinnamea TaxID=321318 RepID=A0AAW5QCG1_9ACTN|nr:MULTISPECIES: 2-amino-4-hydroxy-6-hydroxymethyldihydropteridine diphosphokinase [Dietzia]MBM7229332.1 2-amino-4-hydroxy-6-hydroxymethyldihydropteridine diphosphokinase [Dietzia cinnamea]MCT1865595.1 2-amino-4-hydroxy-6-hydroxymethyldihydropteridine diphosphokinase [Dietzia cinnamea]MCT1886653.1 2-amino-4-hydroxy-6-hydroxymethyldihydropteridine diphosphokinase [Dietzia cinnamea]MCT2031638.1 2-amino-4-hydroxy-6-hydroxymethyldihydropteridine diphosphokinase [Dietzia cinnamea]MCT2033474.1 2-ami
MSCRAVLSIGGNRGDALGLLRGVADAAAADGILRAASSVYATPPWGGVEQDDFLNAALVVEHPGSPADVLEWGFARERAAGRTREVRWGPRTLDVDVVTADVDGETVVSDDPTLTLPHPRAAERAFVLVPWLEIDPGARLAGVPVTDRLAALDPAEVSAVRRLDVSLAPRGWESPA